MYLVSKKIEIDAAHRIPDHHSKCKSVHGHRYVIEAVCCGELAVDGAQQAMAGGLDFGFLKEEMVIHIDLPCDHGLILCENDPLMAGIAMHVAGYGWARINNGYFSGEVEPFGKIYVIDKPPTAEVLAEHWFKRLIGPIQLRSQQAAQLFYVKVYETPTCWAQYPAYLPQVLHNPSA